MNHPFGCFKSLLFFNSGLIRSELIIGKLIKALRRRIFTQIVLLPQHHYAKIPFVNERLREERDQREVQRSLARLRDAAQAKDNLMPYLIDAAKAYSTIGEITATLKEVFGEYSDQRAY